MTMSTNWKSVRLRLEMRTLMVFLAILSFDSCFSLGNEEGVTRDLRPDDRYALDLRGVSFHRKLLGRFRNPYTHLNKDRPPVAALAPASSSVPSHRGTTTRKSSALHPPRRSPPALHVSSAPPHSVPLSKNPSVRSSSSSMVPVVAGCVGGLSGQLQKVFITGVPKLKRSEIEAACEDFSNVIGSCPIDKESEHLDWIMRLRISMGVAYCLDHMHGLKPPIVHSNLISSSVQLTEDYAVKIADFNFGYLKGPSETETSTNALIDTHISVTTQEDNVHSFGLLLFELMTGKLPESVRKGDSVDTGLADFLRGKTLREMVDPTLECFDEKIESIGEVVKSCVRADPKQRPTMKEVTGRLREITGLSPDDAIPKLSALWWAELEVLSTA
ncbi:hypothetical protein HID58_035516 [Brassica napus]|uniref:Protein kinase domain-containing protein n=1 Tax=Brassica napus TaxID=3708 RepID=A0ABQ8C559_BRANA|nr:hypothetical protein HID58_035516 [Brassica napus]